MTFTFFLGCSEKSTEKNSEINATIFFGSEPKNEKFNLTFSNNEKSLNFIYVSQIDTTKTVVISKIKNTDTLLFGFERFLKTDKKPLTNDNLKGLEFEFYDTVDYADDATGPILFNPKYGVLAINNVYGPTIIFLNEKDNELTEQIFTALNE